MQDILGAVNDFILAYVGNNEVTKLSQDQIFRGWQNYVLTTPSQSQEYAIITLLNTIRHGTNIHARRNASGDTGLINTISRYAEHMVQVDFCSAYPNQTEENARIRAEILEMLTRDSLAVNFFKQYGLSSCYADDLVSMPFQDESESWVARYIVTMHLSGWTATNIFEESFEEVKIIPSHIPSGTQDIYSISAQGVTENTNNYKIHFENVDVHHKIKK